MTPAKTRTLERSISAANAMAIRLDRVSDATATMPLEKTATSDMDGAEKRAERPAAAGAEPLVTTPIISVRPTKGAPEKLSSTELEEPDGIGNLSQAQQVRLLERLMGRGPSITPDRDAV